MNKRCILCDTKFHICGGCRYKFHEDLGYCCNRCLNTDLSYEDFYKYFKYLLKKCTVSCFERDILRDNRENMWQSWCKREYNRKYGEEE